MTTTDYPALESVQTDPPPVASQAELRRLADEVHAAVECAHQGDADAAVEQLANLARTAITAERARRDQMAIRRHAAAAVAEPGLGGHRWYLPDDGPGASWTCATCPTRVMTTAIPVAAGLPPCGERCGLSDLGHFVMPQRGEEFHVITTNRCIYCKTDYPVQQATGAAEEVQA